MSQMVLPTLDAALSNAEFVRIPPPQLLKWVGNKQRFAPEIVKLIPTSFGRYIEPFVGSGAVLGAVAPKHGIAADVLAPLIDFWNLVKDDPGILARSYASNYKRFQEDPANQYRSIRARYNKIPTPGGLLFLSRSCYGGIVRFTKSGQMSTPIGPHTPISPETFQRRLELWTERIRGTKFVHQDFSVTIAEAERGDVIYCDPPYAHSQSILYGAQAFQLERLWESIGEATRRGAKVLLSIDGSKKSGDIELCVNFPKGLFKREIRVACGRSMLRRFQRAGQTLEGEMVQDRLMLSWS